MEGGAVAMDLLEGGAVAMDLLVFILSFALLIKQWYIDSDLDGNEELVFINFSVLAKSVSCFKQFVTAYHALHTNGSEVSGILCLLGFFLHSFAITFHLNRIYKSRARIMILGMATLMAAGIFLIYRGMLIPSEHALNAIAVPAIIIFLVSCEVVLLVRMPQGTEDGGDQHLLRDLFMKLVDVSISMYLWVKLIAQHTSYPWEAETILNLVGGGLTVLIGAYLIACILYKMDIMCKVINWFRKIDQVFAGEEEHIGSALEVDKDGSVDKQAVEQDDIKIVVAPAAAAATAVAAAAAAA